MKQSRAVFAEQVTVEVDRLQAYNSRYDPFAPTRLRWLLASLRVHTSDSVQTIIDDAEQLYQDDVAAQDVTKLRDDNEGMRECAS